MSTLTIDQLLLSPLQPSFRRQGDEDEEESAAARGRAVCLAGRPRSVGFYDEEGLDMLMEAMGSGVLSPPPPPPPPQQQQQVVWGGSNGEDHELRPPKKRSEMWVQEETRTLVCLRREMDALFNASKSNKHLWHRVSARMRDAGFDRSPTMCTDKWRNLLKEFKKAKQQVRAGYGPSKMVCYKEIDEILKERSKYAKGGGGGAAPYGCPTLPSPGAAVDSFLQYSDKARPTLNSDRQSVPDGDPLAITVADTVGANGVPPWNWRETGGNGGQNIASYNGRVIFVKSRDYTRKIGIDASAKAIKEAIRSAFGLRTGRAFWLEDEDEVVRSLDRDMPLGTYTLHLDEGVTIKVCLYDEPDQLQFHTEEKTLYTEEDFRELLGHRGWTALRAFGGLKTVDILEELRPDALYEGVRLLGD